jgi:hypothetical protein
MIWRGRRVSGNKKEIGVRGKGTRRGTRSKGKRGGKSRCTENYIIAFST